MAILISIFIIGIMESRIFNSDYYHRIIKEYGYSPMQFGEIDFSLGNIDRQRLRLRWLCHHQADVFAERFAKGEQSIVCTGIGLTGPPHIGTLSQIIRAVEIQKAGIPVQLVLGDLDAYNGKNKPLVETRKLAIKYRDFVEGIGFKDEPPSTLRDQYDWPEFLLTSYLISKYMDKDMFDIAEEDLHNFYASQGKVDTDMSYRRMQSLNLMTADFIHNIMARGIGNILVTLGVDEHKYVLFGMETLEKLKAEGIVSGNALFAGMYSPIIRGLYGYPKMSKSFPNSSITADLSPEEVRKRIDEGEGSCFDPEDNPVFQMLTATTLTNYDELARVYYECANQTDEWKKIKLSYAEYLNELFSHWSK